MATDLLLHNLGGVGPRRCWIQAFVLQRGMVTKLPALSSTFHPSDTYTIYCAFSSANSLSLPVSSAVLKPQMNPALEHHRRQPDMGDTYWCVNCGATLNIEYRPLAELQVLQNQAREGKSLTGHNSFPMQSSRSTSSAK